ncbi:hypothetical protein BB559_004219 [Furculomyces boomerangus]|uniref:Mitochondrial distribution and morphology protein 31 n=1 Tax=Furculomyces boomerangus TaxID=61424 RepID=A0A2T9YFY5_9FUNG|nr:hypothetical protein BB559_004219 [Furculomyces boomerangus]
MELLSYKSARFAMTMHNSLSSLQLLTLATRKLSIIKKIFVTPKNFQPSLRCFHNSHLNYKMKISHKSECLTIPSLTNTNILHKHNYILKKTFADISDIQETNTFLHLSCRNVPASCYSLSKLLNSTESLKQHLKANGCKNLEGNSVNKFGQGTSKLKDHFRVNSHNSNDRMANNLQKYKYNLNIHKSTKTKKNKDSEKSDYKIAGLLFLLASSEIKPDHDLPPNLTSFTTIESKNSNKKIFLSMSNPSKTNRYYNTYKLHSLFNNKSLVLNIPNYNIRCYGKAIKREYSTKSNEKKSEKYINNPKFTEIPNSNKTHKNTSENHKKYDYQQDNQLIRYKPNQLRVIGLEGDMFNSKNKTKNTLNNSLKTESKATKSQVLMNSKGVVDRLYIHFQFFLKGTSTSRPWTLDDVMALGSWILMSQAVWILIGTTTFVSVVLFILNQLKFDAAVASVVSHWVSKAVGLSVQIESAIIPKWSSGKITLKNLKVECGPQHAISSNNPGPDFIPDTNFTYYKLHIDEIDVELSLVRWLDGKGIIKKCLVRGARGVVDRRHIFYDYSIPYNPEEERKKHIPGYFDIEDFEAENVMITLLNPGFRPVPVAIYSASLGKLRQQWFFYDFLSASSMVGMYDNSLFSVRKIKQTSKSPLLTLDQKISSGSIAKFDESNQNLDYSYGRDYGKNDRKTFSEYGTISDGDSSSNLFKMDLSESHSATEIKISNLDICHFNYGVEGPIGWITSGRVDVNSLILLPNNNGNMNPSELFQKLVNDLANSIDVVILPSPNDWMEPESSENMAIKFLLTSGALDTKLAKKLKERIKKNIDNEAQRRLILQQKRVGAWDPLSNFTTDSVGDELESTSFSNYGNNDYSEKWNQNISRSVYVGLNVSFNNIRASVPLTTPHLSYLNSTLLVRPIVSYMHNHRVSLPMRCKLHLDIENFNGSWNAYDSCVVDLVSLGVGKAFAQLVTDEQERKRRLKLIGLWSVSAIAKQATLFLEYLTGVKGFWEFIDSNRTMPGLSF